MAHGHYLRLLSFLTSFCVSKFLAFFAAFLTSFKSWCFGGRTVEHHVMDVRERTCQFSSDFDRYVLLQITVRVELRSVIYTNLLVFVSLSL